jgi:hypothetical protein
VTVDLYDRLLGAAADYDLVLNRERLTDIAPGVRRSIRRSAVLALLVGSRTRVMPASFQAMPHKPFALSKIK